MKEGEDMAIKNSIRQMCRTPLKTLMFLGLIAISGLLVTLGVNLFYISEKTREAAEGAFVTVGTVEQKESAVSRRKYWDYETQQYEYSSVPVYDSIIPDSVLNLEGISYIHEPKHRPYYMAHKDGYVVRNTHSEVDEAWMGAAGNNVIVEVSPFEDCVPDHPVKLHYNKTLFGKITDRMLSFIWFWDYTTPEPPMLYADKTYIMSLEMNVSLEYREIIDKEKYPEVTTVWTPWMDIQGSQYKKDGTEVPDEDHEGVYYEEVTDGFYDTKEGKRWLNLIEGFQISDYGIPVIPTDATKLLPYFNNGDAGISDGRDISEEEYAEGKKVCLIQAGFAKNNKLAVGDKLELPLYYADYRLSAGRVYHIGWTTQGTKMINADGEVYRPFSSEEYEVVGIYQVSGGQGSYTGYEAAENGVVVPGSSITASDEDHILDFGPMKGYTTLFQLENGTTDEFWEIVGENEVAGLEINIEDGGYTTLENNFQNTRKMALILLAAGTGAAALILIFFCYMFIAKQKLRTAIERTMGMTKRQCRASLLGGILAISFLGVIAGCAAGAAFTGKMAGRLEHRTEYSSMFSSNQAAVENQEPLIQILQENHMDIVLPIATGVVIFAAAGAIASVMVQRNLREEPLRLLAEMKRAT